MRQLKKRKRKQEKFGPGPQPEAPHQLASVNLLYSGIVPPSLSHASCHLLKLCVSALVERF